MPFDSGVSYREPAESMTKHETDPTCGNGRRDDADAVAQGRLLEDRHGVRWYRHDSCPDS